MIHFKEQKHRDSISFENTPRKLNLLETYESEPKKTTISQVSTRKMTTDTHGRKLPSPPLLPQVAQSLPKAEGESLPLSPYSIASSAADRIPLNSSAVCPVRLFDQGEAEPSTRANPTATTFPYTGFRQTCVKGEGRI